MTPAFCLLQQHENYARMIRRLGGRAERVNGLLTAQRFGLGWSSYAGGQHHTYWLSAVLARDHAVLDVTPSVPNLRRGLAQKWRNRLNAAVRSGLVIRREGFDGDPAHWLLERNRHQAASQGYAQWSDAMTCAYARTRGAARIYVALQGNRTIGAVMVLMHGTGATYHIGWRERTSLPVHNLLLWSAICDVKADGITSFDLGVLPKQAHGLNRFKLGTGAKPTRIETRIGLLRPYSPIIHSPSGQKA